MDNYYQQSNHILDNEIQNYLDEHFVKENLEHLTIYKKFYSKNLIFRIMIEGDTFTFLNINEIYLKEKINNYERFFDVLATVFTQIKEDVQF